MKIEKSNPKKPEMKRTKYTGVYIREYSDRRNPRDGKADACFYCTYTHEGKKTWKKIGLKSEGYTAVLASEMRAKSIQTARHGETISTKNKNAITFNEAWKIYREKWLNFLSRSDAEEGRFRKHIALYFGNTLLNRIKPIDLDNFKQILVDKKLAPKTIEHVLSNVRRVFNKMIEWEIYEGSSPFIKFKMPKIDNSRLRFLYPAEADSLLSELKNNSEKWWFISYISLHAGLRLGEILRLRACDLDFQSSTIHVLDAKEGTRIAYMSENIKEAFLTYNKKNSSDLLFPTDSGKIIKYQKASTIFTNGVKKVGLNNGITDRRQKVVFHTLRHTFGSWLAMRGVALYTIAELMGHSTIEMTQRYAHLCPSTHRQAIQEIDFATTVGFNISSF